MPVTATMASAAPLNAFNKVITALNNSVKVKCALFTSSFSYNQETALYSSLTNECAATGNYSTGGATCTGCTLSEATKVTTFTTANVSWASSTISAQYAVYYDSDSSVILATVNFGAVYSSTNGTFQITTNGSGVFTITVA